MVKKKNSKPKPAKEVKTDKGKKGITLKPGDRLAKCNDCKRVFKSRKDDPQCWCGSRNVSIIESTVAVPSENPKSDSGQKNDSPAVEIGNISIPVTPEDVVLMNNMKKDGRYGNTAGEILHNSLSKNVQTTNLGDNSYGGNQNMDMNKMNEYLELRSKMGGANNMIQSMMDMKMAMYMLKQMGMDDGNQNNQNSQVVELMKKMEEKEKQEQFAKQLEQISQSNQKALDDVKRSVEVAQASGKQLNSNDLLLQFQTIFSNNQQQIEKIRSEAEIAKQQLVTSQLSSIQQQLAQHQNGMNTGQFTPNGFAINTQIAGLKDTIAAVKEVSKEFAPAVKEESTMEQAGKILGDAMEKINPTVLAPIGAAIAGRIASAQQPTPSLTLPPQQIEQQPPNLVEEVPRSENPETNMTPL